VRWSLLLLVIAIPTLAFAEPKVAVAPLDGDDGKVAEAVGDLIGDHAKVTRPSRVESAMKGMGASVLSPKTARKLRTKLDVDVVIYGSVDKDSGEKHLSLTFAGSAKEKPTLEVTFKSTKQLEKTLGKKLKKRIDSAMEGSDGDREDDEEEARAKKEEERRQREEEERKQREEEERKKEEEAKRKEEERRKKEEEDERRAERERKKREDDDRKKHRNDDDEDEDSGKRRRASRDDDDRKKRDRDDDRKKHDRDDDDRKKHDRDDDEEDDRGRRKKRVADEDEDTSARRRLDDDEDERDRDDDEDDRGHRRRHRREHRHVLSQATLFADAGGAFARRTFTYDAAGTMRPPPVGTASVAGRFAFEAYPASFSSLKGPAAGLGIAFDGTKTVGLGIKVPGTAITVPIKEGQYSIGARYRFTFGDAALAVGAGFWRRYYIADRSKLMNPDQLDMPDVEYSAFAPVVELHVGAGPKIDAFGSFDFPLMYKTGPIQNPNNNYGAAKILAFDLRGGTQIMVASHMALQIAADFDQVALSFTQQPGSKSATRMVTKATDRSIGLSATLGITY
jgi:hypothetical protein